MHVAPGLHRSVDLERLADRRLDLLVIGAGATGAGVALDAATRGLRVGLVDRGDVAQGTSSKSSKLVHGGLRYLENGDVGMVAEGVRERDRLRRLAPHLVRPLGFVVPADTALDAALLMAGMAAYDLLSAGRSVAPSRRLSAVEVLQQAPALARGFEHGGVRYFDAQTDDARLVLHVAMTARRHGAAVVTHAAVESVEPTSAGSQVHLRVDGDRMAVRTRHVVVAGGVWTDVVDAVPEVGLTLTPAKGTHLTLPRSLVPVHRATVVGSAAGDGRRLFLVPWGQQVYVGTNDVEDPQGRGGPVVTAADADYLLDAVNHACGTDLSPADAVGAWAGLRPLVGGGADTASADLSRRHVVTNPRPGVWAVTGGKLTTFRQMAEDVVDAVLDADGDRRRCRTPHVPLGASGSVAHGRARTRAAGAAAGLSPGTCDTLWHRHGDRAGEVVAWCRDREATEPIASTVPWLAGELSWAVQVEGARSVEDVLARRLRMADRHAAAGGPAIERTAALLADHLGWDRSRTAAEADAYRTAVARERGVVPLAGAGT